MLDALAKQRAAVSGRSFEKCYVELLEAGGNAVYGALKDEQAARVG